MGLRHRDREIDRFRRIARRTSNPSPSCRIEADEPNVREHPADPALRRVASLRVLPTERDSDKSEPATIGRDFPGTDPARAYRPQIVGKDQRYLHERDGRSSHPTAGAVDGPPARDRLGGDDEGPNSRLDRASQTIFEGGKPPLPAREVPREPAAQVLSAQPVRLDMPRAGLRVGPYEPVGRDPDRDLAADAKGGREQRLVPGMQVVERPAQDRELDLPHAAVPPNGPRC